MAVPVWICMKPLYLLWSQRRNHRNLSCSDIPGLNGFLGWPREAHEELLPMLYTGTWFSLFHWVLPFPVPFSKAEGWSCMQLLCMQYHTKTRLKENTVLDSQGPKIQKDESPTCVVIIINLLGVYSYRTFHLVPVLLVDRLILSFISFSTLSFLYCCFSIIFPLLHALPQALLGAFSIKALLCS